MWARDLLALRLLHHLLVQVQLQEYLNFQVMNTADFYLCSVPKEAQWTDK